MRRKYYLDELNKLKQSYMKNDIAQSWIHLERAHVLSQFFWKEHFYVHLLMFGLALKVRNIREAFFQIPRLILAIPGSVFKSAPKGNVGTSRVGIFEEMEISSELQIKLKSNNRND